jgi:cell wall-associated NlpC family hydrolase
LKKYLLLFLCLLVSSPAYSLSIKKARHALVSRTMDYLAIPYLWGGQNPETGLDCSGFVQMIYKKEGLNLPRVSRDQFRSTKYLKFNQVLPGDLIFFAMKSPGTAKVDHVGVYVGKGYFVHASFSKGIHIDRINNQYYYKRLVGIRKYKGF